MSEHIAELCQILDKYGFDIRFDEQCEQDSETSKWDVSERSLSEYENTSDAGEAQEKLRNLISNCLLCFNFKGAVKYLQEYILRKFDNYDSYAVFKEELEQYLAVKKEDLKNIEYVSCYRIDMFCMAFNRHFSFSEIRLCCSSPLRNPPHVKHGKTEKETFERFIQMYDAVIWERKLSDSKQFIDSKHMVFKGCKKCIHNRLGSWKDNDGLIHQVTISVNPAPCQCRCVYCAHVKSPFNDIEEFNKDYIAKGHEAIFNLIKYADENGLIANDARWQVSVGEITIHPYKDRIYDLVKDKNVIFFTNCFIYDKRIGEILNANPLSKINLSIDAGTAKTWHEVKGFDNFEKILDNLTKYHDMSSGEGQITLNYMVLPGINDNHEDYLSVIKIMRTLGVYCININRDGATISKGNEYSEKLTKAAGLFLAMLRESKLEVKIMPNYSADEQGSIQSYAEMLLSKGELPHAR